MIVFVTNIILVIHSTLSCHSSCIVFYKGHLLDRENLEFKEVTFLILNFQEETLFIRLQNDLSNTPFVLYNFVVFTSTWRLELNNQFQLVLVFYLCFFNHNFHCSKFTDLPFRFFFTVSFSARVVCPNS